MEIQRTNVQVRKAHELAKLKNSNLLDEQKQQIDAAIFELLTGQKLIRQIPSARYPEPILLENGILASEEWLEGIVKEIKVGV